MLAVLKNRLVPDVNFFFFFFFLSVHLLLLTSNDRTYVLLWPLRIRFEHLLHCHLWQVINSISQKKKTFLWLKLLEKCIYSWVTQDSNNPQKHNVKEWFNGCGMVVLGFLFKIFSAQGSEVFGCWLVLVSLPAMVTNK